MVGAVVRAVVGAAAEGGKGGWKWKGEWEWEWEWEGMRQERRICLFNIYCAVSFMHRLRSGQTKTNVAMILQRPCGQKCARGSSRVVRCLRAYFFYARGYYYS